MHNTEYNDLQQLINEVSLESLSIDSTISLEAIKFKLPKLLVSIREFFKNYLDETDLKFAQFNVSKMYNDVKVTKYTDLRRVKVIQPKGLKVTYIEYIKSLNNVQDLLDKLIPETLRPLEAFLGALLTIPDEARSQIETAKLSSVTLHNVDAASAELKSNFDMSQAEKRPYGDLIKRNLDWAIVLGEFNKLSGRIGNIDKKVVNEYIELISSHIGHLSENLKSDPEMYEVSGVTASSLAKFIHHVANEVELLAIQSYSIIALEASINDAYKVATEVGVK